MKDFLSEQSVGNRFFPFRIYIRRKTAKRDRKTVCFTKSSQNTYHKWQKKYTAGAKAPAVCRIIRGCNFVQHQSFLKIELIKNYMLSLHSLRRCSIPQGFCRFSMQEIFRLCKKAGCRLRFPVPPFRRGRNSFIFAISYFLQDECRANTAFRPHRPQKPDLPRR